MTRSTRIAGTVASLALMMGSLGLAAPAGAAAPDQEPCAKEQKHADRAQDALERVTAVFAKQQTKVKEAKSEAKHADNRNERAAARQDLKDAKVKKDKVKESKKAQQQRVAKTQERLETCQAEQVEEPTTEG